jgi:hypothetical protein
MLLVLTVLVGLWWYSRAKLPYNEEGRWFDPEQMIVYEEQTEELLRIWFMMCFAEWVISMVGPAKPHTARSLWLRATRTATR